MGAVDRTALVAAARLLLDSVEPQVRHASRRSGDEQAEAVAKMAEDALESMRDELDTASRDPSVEINLYAIRLSIQNIKVALPPVPEPRPPRTGVRERAQAIMVQTVAQVVTVVGEHIGTVVSEHISARVKAAGLGLRVLGGGGDHATVGSSPGNRLQPCVAKKAHPRYAGLSDRTMAARFSLLLPYLTRDQLAVLSFFFADWEEEGVDNR